VTSNIIFLWGCDTIDAGTNLNDVPKERMDEYRNLYRAVFRKPEIGRLLVRHGHSWENSRINLQGKA
jgi:hypothetical protein